MFWRKKRPEEPGVDIRKAMELKEVVADVPREWLLDVYWMLMDLQWPEKLCEKPSGWDQMTYHDQYHFLYYATSYIEDRISLKERMRYIRAREYDETEEQFNDWWESLFVEALQRFASRI